MRVSSLMLRRCVSWPLCNSSVCSGCLRHELGWSRRNSSTMNAGGASPRVLIYILRHDVRLSDNPIFHAASLRAIGRRSDDEADSTRPIRSRGRGDSLMSRDGVQDFTHLLPVYVFPAHQVEVAGFIPAGSKRSPYPEARSQVAGVWRTGPHRVKFMAQGVWDLKTTLRNLKSDSDLEVRVGMIGDVVEHMLDWYEEDADDDRGEVAGIWMTSEEGTEEKHDEHEVRRLAKERGVELKVWDDEKYYVDDRDLPFDKISDLPNVYTTYRKSVEPLRQRPRKPLPPVEQLPPLPPNIPPQKQPFKIPDSLDGLIKALLSPLEKDPTYGLKNPPRWPEDVESAHPFEGGESMAQGRLKHLISSGAMSTYKETRNGMLGLDFSTKLSAFLAQGHVTARQVHAAMVEFEEGRGPGSNIDGYGKGENEGTAGVRFELLWRDYMRLCVRKFGSRMFGLYGIQEPARSANSSGGYNELNGRKRWKMIDQSGGAGDNTVKTREAFMRFRSGLTGTGLIDAANRELFLTGYTSNRARQNVASFLTAHLGIDWRVGAEWYEFLLTDYDLANNWGNWQYVAGVGNDPRQGRVFNPVKQAMDYDGRGEYIKAWVPELRGLLLTRSVGPNKEQIDEQKLMGLYQAWKLDDAEKEKLGLEDLEWVEKPLVRIQFSVGKGRGRQNDGRGRGRGRGSGRGRGDGGRNFKRLGQEEKTAWRS